MPRKSQRYCFTSLKFNDKELDLLKSLLVGHPWDIFETEFETENFLLNLFPDLKKEVILDTCQRKMCDKAHQRVQRVPSIEFHRLGIVLD